jgi:hypothetical protein
VRIAQRALPIFAAAAATAAPEQLGWHTFTTSSDVFLKPQTSFGPLITAQYLPQSFWSGVALSEIEAWIRANVPTEMSEVVDRGMESARLRLARKAVLVRQADNYLGQRG